MKQLMTLTLTLSLVMASSLLSAAEPGHQHGDHSGHVMPEQTMSPAPTATPHQAHGSEPSDIALEDPGATPTHDHMQASRFTWLKLDELEAVDTDDDTAASWEGGISWGGHFDRLWLTSEGERQDGHSEELETQLYWSHAVARWWDTTLGVRHDSGEGPSRTRAAFGIRGLAPYWFETEATAFVGEEGHTALRLEAEYEFLLTNRLILQPQVELNFYGKEEAARLQGSGLADSEVGLRLRYEIRREIAPYIGVEWQRLHGESADLANGSGKRVHDTAVVAGIRLWY